jgi:hypothetical protein
VTRVVRFGARFRKAEDRLGVVTGSARGRAVGTTIAALAQTTVLPAPGDTIAMMPPSTAPVFARRVPNRNLWIWYRADEDTLHLIHLSSEPPVPSDA